MMKLLQLLMGAHEHIPYEINLLNRPKSSLMRLLFWFVRLAFDPVWQPNGFSQTEGLDSSLFSNGWAAYLNQSYSMN